MADIFTTLDERKDLNTDQKKRIRHWLEGGFDQETKQVIVQMIEKKDSTLVDAFYTVLSFGTAGLRGIMGVGSNRINEYTISWATQGLANYVHTLGVKNPRAVIGYDSRNHSRHFAQTTAQVLAGNGFTVFLCKNLRPTPLVSFACRYYKCQTAVMITASHNPPEYNGYKVYWDDGGQVLPPHDVGIIEEVQKIQDPKQVKKSDLNDPRIIWVEEEVDKAYLDAIRTLRLYPHAEGPLRIIYSSLHGTGITLVPHALQQCDFSDVRYVEKQVIPDGNFPTAHFPNPEEPEAMKLGTDKMLREEADLFIATDPDCDRVGVVVHHKGKAVPLTGNQVVALLAKHICQALTEQKRMPPRPAFVKTIVTTELFRSIVESYKASCVDVLTGFKYIAERIRQWEQESNGKQFVFGGEESYGYLFGTYARDKDAVISTCLIAEVARHAKRAGKTLVDYLNDIYLEWGFFAEIVVSWKFEETKVGKDTMAQVMSNLRKLPPQKLSEHAVVAYSDFLIQEKQLINGTKEKINLPVADVLIFELDEGSRVVVRPSGTEPKIKVYFMLRQKLETKTLEALERAKQEAAKRAQLLEAAVKLISFQ